MTTYQPAGDESDGVRFGRTLILPVVGPVLDQQVQAIVCPANRRGVMGAGITGQIRMAGGIEIEREAMAQAPLTIGSAISTTSGELEVRGIRCIIHAVVSDALGAPTRLDIVRSATTAALVEADRRRVKSLLLPPLGSGLGPGRLPSGTVAVAMIEETVAYLRRFTCRLDRIVLAQHDRREAEDIRQALIEARELWWGLKV
jgi:O-acetyl-ADP-ribose deacetylase (regulator of RNase III)